MTVACAVFAYDEAVLTATVCPVCGHDNPSQPARDRYGYAVGVSTCACGLRYLNPRMSLAQYEAFYRSAYRPLVSAYCGVDTASAAIERSSARRGKRLGSVLGPYLNTRCTSLLDVGGGSGVVSLSMAAGLNISAVTVVDPNGAEVTRAISAGCRGIVGAVEALSPATQTYDLITCLLTADHWLDPLAALRWMRTACAPGGHLWIDIIDVPATNIKQSLRAGHVEYAIETPLWKIDHPLYWTRASFQRALILTGWRAQQIFIEANTQGQLRNGRPSFLCEGV